MKRKMPVWIALSLVILVGAAAGAAGAVLGFRDGVLKGLLEGERRASVRAARQPPLVIRDKRVPASKIFTPEIRATVSGMSPDDEAPLTRILNRAPSSCYRLAVKGISLASSLVAPPSSTEFCATASPQVHLAWTAWNTFHDEQEAIAVLKVERRRNLDLTHHDARGPQDAPVTLVEYADYQCPYCVRAKPLINSMLARGDVKFVFKHLPLKFHPAARPAAHAVEAASKQDKRWQMHDVLFSLGKDIVAEIDKAGPMPKSGPVPFESHAKTLGLDVEQFRNDFRSDDVKKRVAADEAEAKLLNINSTPTFYINDRRVVENRSKVTFDKLVDLAKLEAAGKFSWGLDDIPGPKKIPSEKEMEEKINSTVPNSAAPTKN